MMAVIMFVEVREKKVKRTKTYINDELDCMVQNQNCLAYKSI